MTRSLRLVPVVMARPELTKDRRESFIEVFRRIKLVTTMLGSMGLIHGLIQDYRDGASVPASSVSTDNRRLHDARIADRSSPTCGTVLLGVLWGRYYSDFQLVDHDLVCAVAIRF